MKNILFLSMLLVSVAEAKQIVLDIPDADIKIVENDVVDAEAWLRSAWAGKVNKCKERMVETEFKRSLAEKSNVPSTEDAIVAKAMSRKDYKNRKQRDASMATGKSTAK